MFTIKQILQATSGNLIKGNEKNVITSIHFDSRKIEKDALFVALIGGNSDGHAYIERAVTQGAAAVLVSKPYETNEQIAVIHVPDTEKALQQLAAFYRSTLSIPIIAITGSNGKTTTKDMIAHVLSQKVNVHKTQGNLNNHLGMPLTLLQTKPEHEVVVLEMGMNHKGEIDLLASIAKPTMSVITNIGDAHIEHLGSRENIAHAKGELLPHTNPTGCVFLNAEMDFLPLLQEKYQGEIVRYGKGGSLALTSTEPTEQGTIFRIQDEKESFFIPVFGDHNILNALAAMSIANRLGFSKQEIKEALANLKISSMRFEVQKGKNDSLIINDAYNASPTSMKASIETFLSLFPKRKKVLILGDMFELGKESLEMHKQIGKLLTQHEKEIEYVVTIGKDSAYISNELRVKKKHIQTKEEAKNYLQSFLTNEHALLFKASRGMKLEEIIHTL
jgi:UDP-N-acetylmuramoyl-tripeptide--D-alanyl-D-alanine ligase